MISASPLAHDARSCDRLILPHPRGRAGFRWSAAGSGGARGTQTNDAGSPASKPTSSVTVTFGKP
jgi:hypothetical protein